MKISEARLAFKIADAVHIPETMRLKFIYLNPLMDNQDKEIPQSVLTNNVARVYLIVVNGEIVKIGGSQALGGMKKTLEIYQTGGVNGRPSIRSVGIWYFLFSQIVEHRARVEFYMVYQPNFPAKVTGLYRVHDVPNASLSYKLLETCCLEDYREKEGKYPPWNLQEGAADWPKEVRELHNDMYKASDAKSTARGRRIAGRVD